MARTIHDLLPPVVRDWVYAILIALNGGYLVAEAALDVHVAFLIALGVINAGGFTLARSNTPV